MQPLDLYATVEEYFGFQEEIDSLHNEIKDIIALKKPQIVIDIGCGQGKFCKLLSSNGVKVMGVDISQKQINIALEKGIDVEHIDIQDIITKYDCATAVFDVVNYLSKEHIEEFIESTYKLLNHGGYFIFDVNSLYGFEEVACGTLNIDVEEKFIAIDANFVNNKLHTDITLFTQDGKNYKKDNGTIVQYYYSNEDLKDILIKQGFEIEVIKGFNFYSDEEYDKYIFICKKG